PGPSTDIGGYHNQRFFADYSLTANATRFLRNTAYSCGGHNCIQIHGDTGSPQILGNTCHGPWQHNCIDVKAVQGAVLSGNTIYGGSLGAALYLENTEYANATVTFENNLIYNTPNGIECEWGGTGSGVASTCYVYNN